MKLRPYQEEFVSKVNHAFDEGHDRVIGVAATGAGKTILASDLMTKEMGNCLFLADAQELVIQNAEKFYSYSGEKCGVEMGAQTAIVGVDRVIVATSQTMFRRLSKYPPDYFNLIIVDECHRNTLGAMAQEVLNHFAGTQVVGCSGEDAPQKPFARILGVTATPFRSDRKKLGDFYETIAVEIGLARLIKEGYLSRITIKGIPMEVDLSGISKKQGDYSASELGEVIEPILREAAKQIRDHAQDRKKIVVFLPLIKTSLRMTRILNEMGIKAVHVSGEDKSAMHEFTHGDARVICNAQLLTTGWDCPHVDCVMVLRPTKSLALYQQMVGRGTRIADGKDDLLLLDPLFMTDDHRLITPARLTARTKEQAEAMMEQIHSEKADSYDLLGLDNDIEEQRAEALRARMKAKAKKKMRVVDAIEFALDCNDKDTAEFEPEFGWEKAPPSEKQLASLEKAGFDIEEITSRGQASKVLDLLFMRRQQNLATPKQLRLLKRFGHPSPSTVSFKDASAFIDKKFGAGGAQTISTSLMIELRRAGLRVNDYKNDAEAKRALDALNIA